MLDQQLLFTAGGGDVIAATGVGSNVLDLFSQIAASGNQTGGPAATALGRILGGGERVRVVLNFLAVTPTPQCQAQLQGSATNWGTTYVIVTDNNLSPVLANTQHVFDVPPHPAREFYRLNFIFAGTGNFTVQAALVKDAMTAWPVMSQNY